jgi:single stranded DNA-binding protein
VVAVDTYKKGDPSGNNSTEFYKVEAWGKLGDVVQRFIDKGNQVTAVGRFNIDRWQDKEGRERITPVINATQISLPPRRSASSSQSYSQSNAQSVPSSRSTSDEQELHFSEEEEDAAALEMFGPTTAIVPAPTLSPPTLSPHTLAPPTLSPPEEPSSPSPIASTPIAPGSAFSDGATFIDEGADMQDILEAFSRSSET